MNNRRPVRGQTQLWKCSTLWNNIFGCSGSSISIKFLDRRRKLLIFQNRLRGRGSSDDWQFILFNLQGRQGRSPNCALRIRRVVWCEINRSRASACIIDASATCSSLNDVCVARQSISLIAITNSRKVWRSRGRLVGFTCKLPAKWSTQIIAVTLDCPLSSIFELFEVLDDMQVGGAN